MQPRLALLWASLLLAAPLAYAHDPAGTPKNYCEDPSEWGVHDYAPPSTGRLIFLGQDGNIAGDCDGDGIVADFDGHLEFAFGGGWLTAADVDPACNVETAHHPVFGPISVTDVVLGNTVVFRVASDTVNLVPPTDPAAPDCGDFVADNVTNCVGSCTVTFPPGLDGTYPIFVGFVHQDAPGEAAVGTGGHIISGDGGTGAATTAPKGHVTIHKFPWGTFLYSITGSWTCRDIHTGVVVGVNSPLSEPNPGVRCTNSNALPVCTSVAAGGYHSTPTTTGSLTITSACTNLDVSQSMSFPLANPGVSSIATGLGTPDWTCTTQETGLDINADYWVFCNVNTP
jgi:hypothetical protein